MPLHGKIVVIKRSGGDGTEFPLTATCLFGRKPDCDIRIQLPQVSKEHCRIDLNENKEVVLTNLSSVNPTRVNGEVLQQSERLKHGDVITVIDRSFRFEYPPAPTPKKRSSIGGKPDVKVLQHQQVKEQSAGENRISAVSTGPQLKDGTNHDNIQRSMEKTIDLESEEKEKTASPFNDLYQMIKKSLDVKTPRKSSMSQLQTPSSRFCSPKPVSVKKNGENLVILTKATPKKDEIKVFSGVAEINTINNGTPKSVKKQRLSSQVPSNDMSTSEAQSVKSEASSVPKRISVTPQRFSSSDVVEQITSPTSKSTVTRSKEATPAKQVVTSPKAESHTKASPRKSGNVEKVASKKRKSGELSVDLPASQMKKKRVSFGSNLSPELFDKRMPPDSPLRKGATPRRSFCLSKPKESLLRRVSVIGMIQEHPDYESPAKMKTLSPKKSSSKKSPITQLPAKTSPKSKSPSPKAETPAKKSPKSKSPSPKAVTPAKRSPKSKSPSPKAETPAKKSPKSKSPSPKAETPAKRSIKSKSTSPKAVIPEKKSPKSKSPSPKAVTPAKLSPKSRATSPKALTPATKSPKSKSPSPKAVTPAKTSTKSRATSPKAETSRAGSSKLKSLSPFKGSTPSMKVETPLFQTPTIKGRFSVSRISTPSPASGDTNEVCLDTVTPKLCLKRKSMKSTSRRSSVKAMCRKSGISRVSLKAMNSWAEIVKFGQKRPPGGVPAKTRVSKTTVKKTASKPQTPARKLKDQVSTGHADSPVTIVVGRAHRQKVACTTGAAPRWMNNVGLLKKNMKMDEDLTGISEMYKTPVAERKQRSDITESSMAKTPAGDLSKSCVEPSVLNTPEEPGEMMVSPLNVSTTVTDRSFNCEAVQRLFIGEHKSSFDSEIPALEVASDSCEQSTDSQTSTKTPKLKYVLPNCQNGVNRVKKTPKQKAEPLEDLRGKVLKTPKQKITHQECLTGVKRIMKTPKQNAEPLEDIRGKILKTPKQKVEQQECLTGIKRIMKTPKQKAEPLEDIRGKILKTPKQKIELQECLTGVRRIFSTPQQQAEDSQDKHLESHKPASSDCVDPSGMLHSEVPPTSESSLVCFSGVKRLKTPRVKTAPVEDMVGLKRLLKTPKEKGEPIADNFGIKRLMKSPKLKANAQVEDFEGLKELMELPDPTEQQETNKVKYQTSDGAKGADKNEAAVEQVPSGNESSDTRQTNQVKTDDAPEEKLKPQTAVRGRRARKAEAVSVEDDQKVTVNSEESVISAPVRGRRVKKTEATAPPVVQKSMRSRHAKSLSVEVLVEQTPTPSSKVACKPKRGRNAKKASDDPAEIIPGDVAEAEIVPEPESEQTPLVNFRREANEIVAAVKPRRGRRTKQPDQLMPSTPKDNVTHAGKETESNEDLTHQPEVVSNENNSSDNMETAPQELRAQEITETDAAIIQKKSGRVRRAKVELRPAEENQEGPDQSENPGAPGSSKRGKRTEIAERPTVRQTRNRNAKLQECKSEQVPEESVKVTQVSEINTETASDESSTLAPHHKEAATKSTRGRKTKQELAKPEPEKGDALSEEQPTDKPERPSPTPGKNTRGRRTKTDDVQTAAAEEREHKSVPPVRAKRGRMAKQEDVEEEPTQSQECVINLRRTRKVDPAEPNPVQKDEQEISKEAEAPVDTQPTRVEAHKVTRSRRAQKAAQEKLLAESDDVQKSAVISGMDKPIRGRRGKQVLEVEAVMVEETLALKPSDENEEPEATVGKTRRAKSVKNDVPETIPAKRARRGATLPPVETNAESPDFGSKSESTSKELPRRGRRVAKPSADVAISSGEAPKTAVEDAVSMKTVKWKSDVEVFHIQKLTPVKPVRGRKSKFGDRADTDSQKDSSQPEEKDLSDKVEVQATKRARRGVKVDESTKREDVAPETQPKTRRARLAKK